MKNAAFYLGSILIIFSGCKKENGTSPNQQPQLSFFDLSVQYLKSQLPAEDFSKLNLSNNKILRFRNQNIGIQIFEKNESPQKYLMLKKDGNGFSGNWVDMSELKTSNEKFQSGTVNLENINRVVQTKFIVVNNEVTQMIKTDKNSSVPLEVYFKSKKSANNSFSKTEEEAADELPEIVVYWGGPDSDFSSLYWLFNQDSGFEDVYFQGDSGGDGGGGGTGPSNNTDNVAAAPTFTPPDKPIADIKSELKCFTSNATSTYNISINVNEPFPNDRGVFNPVSDFRVGHTFVTLQQHNADGSVIIRNVGLYPKNSVKPGNSVGPAIFGEDSNTPFDVSLNFSVSGTDFNTVLNTLISQQSVNYDLNNFNCTNSSMDALKSIHINLPSTKSNSSLFGGNDPGDLGEDIRNLNLDSFSANNGNRKITRTESNSNNQTAPAKSGGC